jgi:hypothetical protein
MASQILEDGPVTPMISDARSVLVKDAVCEIRLPLARLKADQAADVLGLSESQFERLGAGDVFTVQRDGSARQAHRFYLYDELYVYMTANARAGPELAKQAVKTHRLKLGRLTPDRASA